MSASNNNPIRAEAFRLVFWQLMIVVGLAAVLLFIHGVLSGVSALLGGLSYCLPNLLFVWRVFERTRASAAKQFLIRFVIGETSKLFLSAIFVVLIIKYLPVLSTAVLGGYIAAVVGLWVLSFIFMSHDTGEGRWTK